QRGGILLAHRLLDLGDRFDPILFEIAEDSNEARTELGPTLLEMRPVNDVPSLVGHMKLLKRRLAPAVVPTCDGNRTQRVKFALAAGFVERIRTAAKIQAKRHRSEIEIAAHGVEQVSPIAFRKLLKPVAEHDEGRRAALHLRDVAQLDPLPPGC